MSNVIGATVHAATNAAIVRNAAGLAAFIAAARFHAHTDFGTWALELMGLLAAAMFAVAHAPGNLDHIRPSSLARRDRELWDEFRAWYLAPMKNLQRNWLWTAGWSVLCAVAFIRTL